MSKIQPPVYIGTSFQHAIFEQACILLYNVLVMGKDPNSPESMVAPESLEERKKLTEIVRSKTFRKTVITKPKGAAKSEPKKPRTQKKQVPAQKPVFNPDYNKIGFRPTTAGAQANKQKIAATLAQCIGVTPEYALKIVDKGDLVDRFNVFIMEIDSARKVSLCTYQKDNRYYVMASMLRNRVGADTGVKWLTGNKKHDEAFDPDGSLSRTIHSYAVIIPELTFPDTKTKKALRDEIENFF